MSEFWRLNHQGVGLHIALNFSLAMYWMVGNVWVFAYECHNPFLKTVGTLSCLSPIQFFPSSSRTFSEYICHLKHQIVSVVACNIYITTTITHLDVYFLAEWRQWTPLLKTSKVSHHDSVSYIMTPNALQTFQLLWRQIMWDPTRRHLRQVHREFLHSITDEVVFTTPINGSHAYQI